MLENVSLISIIISGITLIIGIFIGYTIYRMKMSKVKSSSEQIIQEAKQKAEKINKDRLYQFKVELQQKRSNFQKDLQRKEEKYARLESQLLKKEKDLRREENQIKIKEDRVNNKEKKINELEELLYEKHKKVDNIISKQNIQLQRITNLTIDEAKAQLFKNLEKDTKLESIQVMKEIRDEARENAQREAKEIIANAIENLAYEFTMEATLSTVELPNERFKGMIIGKEGRNILLGDPWSAIGNLDTARFPCVTPHGNCNRLAPRRKLDCVLYQVEQHLPQHLDIRPNRGRIGSHNAFKPQLPGFQVRLQERRKLLDQRAKIDPRRSR